MNDVYPSGPKSKWLEQAQKIASGEIRTNPSDIPLLLSWLKDMNWPGAEIIAKQLPSFGPALANHVETVLRSGDLVWIQGVLGALADVFDAKFWLPLKSSLEEIGFKWDPEMAHVESLYILARYKMMEQERLKSAVEAMKLMEGADPDDYTKIEASFGKE